MDETSVTFIVPTIGRASLLQTLASIEYQQGDEILIVGDILKAGNVLGDAIHQNGFRLLHCPPGGDWGHSERNYATPQARGKYIAHIDDDDTYVPGTRAIMQDAIERTPNRPVIFRMEFPCGIVLWREPEIRCGNLGTPCFLIPNAPEMMGRWGSFVGGDCNFLETSKWKAEDYVWREEIIAKLGHDIG